MVSKSVERSKIFFLLLFLSCLNINEWGSTIFLLLCIFTVIKLGPSIPADKHNYLLCTLLFVICACVSLFFYGPNEAIKCINYCGAYIVGFCAFHRANDKIALIKKSLFAVFAGYSFQIILIFIYNMYVGQPSTRELYAIWNDGLISVTLIALLSSVVVGYSFYAFFCSKNKLLKLYSLVSLIITAITNVLTATRTPFLLIVIVYVILVIAFFKNIQSAAKRNFVVALAIIAVLAAICYYLDWFGVKTFLLNSPLFERFAEEGMQSGRLDIARKFISYMPEYPFGGGFARKAIHNYAHNILLEVYDMFGAIPFLIILTFFVQAVHNIVVVIKEGMDTPCNFLLAGLYCAIIIQMFLEPVIEGFPILFYSFLFIHGICNCYIRYSRKEKLLNEDSANQYM